MEEEDKEEGLLKRIKNVKDKNKEKLKAIQEKTENIKEFNDFVGKSFNL